MVELENDQISLLTWLEGLQNKNVELVYTAQNFLKNDKVQLRGPLGSIEGPRLVFDPMEVRSCVPRGPWNVSCCLFCKNVPIQQILSDGTIGPQSPLVLTYSFQISFYIVCFHLVVDLVDLGV